MSFFSVFGGFFGAFAVFYQIDFQKIQFFRALAATMIERREIVIGQEGMGIKA